MRRPGYLIAAAVLGLTAVAFWFVFFSAGWVERTGFEREPDPVRTTVPAAAPVGDLEAMECQLDVERWDTGRRSEVEAKYGEDAEAVVEGGGLSLFPLHRRHGRPDGLPPSKCDRS